MYCFSRNHFITIISKFQAQKRRTKHQLFAPSPPILLFLYFFFAKLSEVGMHKIFTSVYLFIFLSLYYSFSLLLSSDSLLSLRLKLNATHINRDKRHMNLTCYCQKKRIFPTIFRFFSFPSNIIFTFSPNEKEEKKKLSQTTATHFASAFRFVRLEIAFEYLKTVYPRTD